MPLAASKWMICPKTVYVCRYFEISGRRPSSEFTSRSRFYFLGVWVKLILLYVCVWESAHMCRSALGSEEGVRSLGARLTGSYEPARHWTRVPRTAMALNHWAETSILNPIIFVTGFLTSHILNLPINNVDILTTVLRILFSLLSPWFLSGMFHFWWHPPPWNFGPWNSVVFCSLIFCISFCSWAPSSFALCHISLVAVPWDSFCIPFFYLITLLLAKFIYFNGFSNDGDGPQWWWQMAARW